MRKIWMAVVVGISCSGLTSCMVKPRPPGAQSAQYQGRPQSIPERVSGPPAGYNCAIITKIGRFDVLFRRIPSELDDDVVFRSMVQFLAITGTDIESKDIESKTIITGPFGGQTIESSCGVNEYRTYSLRITVTGRMVAIGMQCWKSFGWEAHVRDGVAMGKSRGPISKCQDPIYVGAADALIPGTLVDGAFAIGFSQ